jgi:8-oxo-dGTP pyrophosphatase MutT (NUDIX family)
MPQPLHKVAAVCCRPVSNGNVMFLLVRSRGGNRWTFPKGTVDASDASPAAAAAREALEEAGVVGTIDPVPLGTYRKAVPARKFEQGEEEEVEAWLQIFTGTRSIGEPGRRPTWFLLERAAMAFRSNPDDPIYTEGLCRILYAAKARLYPPTAISAEPEAVLEPPAQ